MNSWYVAIPSRCMKRYTLVRSMNSREGSQMKGDVSMVLYILACATHCTAHTGNCVNILRG